MGSIGVCYGTLSNNLPSSREVVEMYRRKGIGAMRIYNAEDHEDTINALRGTNIGLIMDAPMHADLLDYRKVEDWVKSYILPYHEQVTFKYIAVGNEVEDENWVDKIHPAMKNMHRAISKFNLQHKIKVSTAVKFDVFTKTYPASHAEFKASHMRPIVKFLSETRAPLLVNVYPFFCCKDEPNILLQYALFQQCQPDRDNEGGREYMNLFDAMVDSVYYALEKAGGSNVKAVVSETGWPSDHCRNLATVENAKNYNQNLVRHITEGPKSTPKWLEKGELEVYIFAMFNENLKDTSRNRPYERYFGLYDPKKEQICLPNSIQIIGNDILV